VRVCACVCVCVCVCRTLEIPLEIPLEILGSDEFRSEGLEAAN
jgi:hypothetical protein